jgi:hypothetical protein
LARSASQSAARAGEAGVQGDGGEVEEDALEGALQVFRGGDGDAVFAGGVELQEEGGGAILEVVEGLGVGAGGVGVGDEGADVPGSLRVGGGAGQGAVIGGVFGRVEGADLDAVLGAPGQALERAVLQGPGDEREPRFAGSGRKEVGQG